uniref:POTRA domain-containing protein n=1 Tax=mine drainage metagenome TaxID=410659 RepID=E6QQ95_9ZZZZ
MYPSMKPLLFAMPMALASLSVQAADPVVSSAGSLLQEIQTPTPPLPPNAPVLTIKRQSVGHLLTTTPFAVKHIEISGNAAFDTQTLHALVATGEGKTLTLAQLDALAARITDYYHRHGYLLVRAIVPPQASQSGNVYIKVIAAHYGQIKLDNGCN